MKLNEINVKFREMNDEEYKIFVENSIQDYSNGLIKSGTCAEEEGFERAKNDFKNLLPDGKQTKDNFLYRIENKTQEDVGILWYIKQSESRAFIADILIFEEFQSKGYGRQTLLLLEKEAKQKGISMIALHVFKFNTIAFSLYSSLGYKVVHEEPSGSVMVKEI